MISDLIIFQAILLITLRWKANIVNKKAKAEDVILAPAEKDQPAT